jgi:hypothetical protein
VYDLGDQNDRARTHIANEASVKFIGSHFAESVWVEKRIRSRRIFTNRFGQNQQMHKALSRREKLTKKLVPTQYWCHYRL